MTTTFRTVVAKLPPTPLGLLPERWIIEHWCSLCRHQIAPQGLLIHARHHHDHDDDHDHPRAHAGPAAPPTTSTIHQEGDTIG